MLALSLILCCGPFFARLYLPLTIFVSIFCSPLLLVCVLLTISYKFQVFKRMGIYRYFARGRGTNIVNILQGAGGSFIANILSICALQMLVEILIINVFLDKKLKNMEKTRYFLQNFAKKFVF